MTWSQEVSVAISGSIGTCIYEKGIKESECILWDMDSGIIFVQKLGARLLRGYMGFRLCPLQNSEKDPFVV